MFGEMVREKEEKREENRRKREQMLMEDMKETSSKIKILKRSEEMMERKEQKIREALKKEKERNQWKNNVIIKEIPDYQREWEIFDGKQKQKKEEIR